MRKGQPVPINQQISAAHRELAIRRKVFPQRVSAGKMRQGEADHEIACMAAIIDTLEWVELHRDTIIAEVKRQREERVHG
jgi:hypothetical protein